MNLVGRQGRGESVWLAFFLFHVLTRFALLARRRGDATRADRYAFEAERLRGNVEQHGWDGQWYRRAYFDDGTPLGSADERRMPDRRDLAKLVGALECGHASGPPRRWRASIAASSVGTTD